jgi:hypothetical protein
MGTIMSCIEPHSLFRVYRFNKKGKETKFNNKIVYSQSLKNTNSQPIALNHPQRIY